MCFTSRFRFSLIKKHIFLRPHVLAYRTCPTHKSVQVSLLQSRPVFVCVCRQRWAGVRRPWRCRRHPRRRIRPRRRPCSNPGWLSSKHWKPRSVITVTQQCAMLMPRRCGYRLWAPKGITIHSKFQSVRVSEIQWKFSQYSTTDFFQWCYIDWNAVNFHWFKFRL